MSQTEHTTRRRGLLTGTLAALLAGTAAVPTAKAKPLPPAGDDAELIRLCAEFDDCERQMEAIYASEADDELAEAGGAAVAERMNALAERIMSSSASSADGILAIARSLAIHNGNGVFDFHPETSSTTGCLMTALLREACLLSGLPSPDGLAGRTST